MASTKVNQMKKVVKIKSVAKKNNGTTKENTSVDQSVKSMSVDSVNNIDSVEVDTVSINESSICSSSGLQLKPSTRLSINSNEDENDEFCKMFMSNTAKFKNNTNYSSTPLRISRNIDRNVHATIHSHSPYSLKDAAHSQLSHSAIDYCSKIPDQNMKSIQTPTNRNVVGALRQSETSSSIRSSSSVQTKSNSMVILETFPEYRELR
ncbi:unnamed protein product [Rotaria sordida]|uniref:Uncharacterized protein n=1 Tax=Rotaria sordida TaxID=392033 RepID=A0A815CT61_9BILA|nr:unnamed protein product [Rotaria sordida]CAF1618433.1 unnamed protein product [Rotaria sordida]